MFLKENSKNHGENNFNSIKKVHKILCIPKIEKSISLDYIKQKLHDFQIFNIIYIKEFPLYNKENYKRILIKLLWDTNNNVIKKMEELIDNLGSIKLVYDMPWYWKIVYNGQHNNSFIN